MGCSPDLPHRTMRGFTAALFAEHHGGVPCNLTDPGPISPERRTRLPGRAPAPGQERRRCVVIRTVADTLSVMPRPQLIENRDRYRQFSSVTTRWKDNDMYGHVNNAVYNVWMDTAVTEFFRRQDPDFPTGQLIPVGAETKLTFHRSICHPAQVETGLRVERIGNSSVRCGVGIFLKGEFKAAAWGHMIHVWVDRDTNAAVPIPDHIRGGLEHALLKLE